MAAAALVSAAASLWLLGLCLPELSDDAGVIVEERVSAETIAEESDGAGTIVDVDKAGSIMTIDGAGSIVDVGGAGSIVE